MSNTCHSTKELAHTSTRALSQHRNLSGPPHTYSHTHLPAHTTTIRPHTKPSYIMYTASDCITTQDLDVFLGSSSYTSRANRTTHLQCEYNSPYTNKEKKGRYEGELGAVRRFCCGHVWSTMQECSNPLRAERQLGSQRVQQATMMQQMPRRYLLR